MSGPSTRAHAHHWQRKPPPLNSKPSTCAYNAPKKRRNAWRRYSWKCLNSCALPKRLASARHTRSASAPPPLRRPLQRLLSPRPHHRPLVLGPRYQRWGRARPTPCLLRQLLTTPYARHWQGKRRLERLLRRPTSGPLVVPPAYQLWALEQLFLPCTFGQQHSIS